MRYVVAAAAITALALLLWGLPVLWGLLGDGQRAAPAAVPDPGQPDIREPEAPLARAEPHARESAGVTAPSQRDTTAPEAAEGLPGPRAADSPRKLREFLAGLQLLGPEWYKDGKTWFEAQTRLDASLGTEEGIEALADWISVATADQLGHMIRLLTMECDNPPDCTGYSGPWLEQLSIPPAIEEALLTIVETEHLSDRSLEVLEPYSRARGAVPEPVAELALEVLERAASGGELPPASIGEALQILTNPLPPGFADENAMRMAGVTTLALELAEDDTAFLMLLGKLVDPRAGAYLLEKLSPGESQEDVGSVHRALHGIMQRLQLDDDRLPTEERASFERALEQRIRDLHLAGEGSPPSDMHLTTMLWALVDMRDRSLAQNLVIDLAGVAQEPGRSEALQELARRLEEDPDRNRLMQYIWEKLR